MQHMKRLFTTLGIVMMSGVYALASEADLKIPDLHAGHFDTLGGISAWWLLFIGGVIIFITCGFSLYLRIQIRKLPAHNSMLKVSEIIYQTCRTYLMQQGKFLIFLFLIISAAMAYYYLVLMAPGLKANELSPGWTLAQVLFYAIIGMGGSYAVAWYGIRVNTYANCRTAFASLKGRPWDVVNIPLRAGMSVGLFLISLELVMMVIILLFVDRSIVGLCFLGFAIGESLGASALRIAGGIFTKIADIGSDLMKIVFKVDEDDPRNPGVIADCTGDNAGDSVGPTADGFETYGVTGVALISFIVLAVVPGIFTSSQAGIDLMTKYDNGYYVAHAEKIIEAVKQGDNTVADKDFVANFKKEAKESKDKEKNSLAVLMTPELVKVTREAVASNTDAEILKNNVTAELFAPAIQAMLIVWIFAMRFLMDCLSGCAYFINQSISEKKYKDKKEFDFEEPLMRLIWIAACLCIFTSFCMSWLLLHKLPVGAWWKLASIIGCGTLAAVLIPEFTKIFTSSKSKHVQEVVTSSREGGPSLNILSGIIAGNFSAFWTGMLIMTLMATAYFIAGFDLSSILGPHAPVFAFGLVAFGFLCMGPVTIAVDSYGPVTDNAQSVFELSQIEKIPNISEEIEKDFGFKPDFEIGKHYLEANDSAGNTFKATAKPVLIGTAVAGATTMIFAIILMLDSLGMLSLSLTEAPVILGLITGGAVIFWFSGASMQAVATGAYGAVEFIKKNMNLSKTEADMEDSKTVVRICTQYAQKGMWNIFIALISLTLAFAFLDPNFFVAYLVSIAVFGLFQAIYMANAGGSWDNAKKVVEVDLKEKGSELHAAAVIGDTVGDPFKDTSSVALNPIIKFSTLFGLLATEIAIEMKAAARGVSTHASEVAADVTEKTVELAKGADYSIFISVVFLAIGLTFVWRSFYAMRIPKKN